MFRIASRIRSCPKIASKMQQSTVAANTQSMKPVAYWLLGVGGLVAGMVTVGGITRLTRSGLSMTDWKLQGSFPPTTPDEWEKEFERYKTFPEWQQRQSMTVDDFKSIYFWEYAHRMMGRFIGLAFALPGAYFLARGRIPKSMYPRIGTLFFLGGSQGLIGWWMVKSGLEMDPQQAKEIRVSPYRLATHLGMAFTTYTYLIWSGLDLLRPASAVQAAAANMSQECLKHTRKIRKLALLNGALVATTVVSGAFVAGNDAGRAYNSFPKMGDDWVPDSVLEMAPKWRNFFENTATVQFDHRVLALTTLTTISAMYASAVRSVHWATLPTFARHACHSVAGMAAIQVGLGISTLLLYVPVPLAAVHQAGSLVLLTLVTCLIHSLNFVKHGGGASSAAVKSAAGAMKNAAATESTAAAVGGVAQRKFSTLATRVWVPAGGVAKKAALPAAGSVWKRI